MNYLYKVEPEPVDALLINPGERFDFVITADQTPGNYWIRAQSMEVITNTCSQIDRFFTVLKLSTKILFSKCSS